MIDRGGPRRLPIEAVEDEQDDPPLAGAQGRLLQAINVGFVEVVGPRIECSGRQIAVQLLKPLLIAVDAVVTRDRSQVDAERVDGNQAIRMLAPLHVLARLNSPVTPISLAGADGFGLKLMN